MKYKIMVSVPELKAKVEQLERDHMGLVELQLIPYTLDQDVIHPGFIHFEGIAPNGSCRDYECVDEFSFLYIESIDAHNSANSGTPIHR